LLLSGKRIPSHRAASLYMGSIRHLFREMLHGREYRGHGNSPALADPFLSIKSPRQETARKRALSPDMIRRICELPCGGLPTRKGHGNRLLLARDCFLLSFGLIGMNSADLYSCTEYKEGKITYHRAKTKDRRADKALMVVKVPPALEGVFGRYRDRTGARVFDFHGRYSTASSFNRAVNIGLKRIGSILGIDDLEFYAARHSWATIAVNRCGIDKYTVHSALNHVDVSMRVTDIYMVVLYELYN